MLFIPAFKASVAVTVIGTWPVTGIFRSLASSAIAKNASRDRSVYPLMNFARFRSCSSTKLRPSSAERTATFHGHTDGTGAAPTHRSAPVLSLLRSFGNPKSNSRWSCFYVHRKILVGICVVFCVSFRWIFFILVNVILCASIMCCFMQHHFPF